MLILALDASTDVVTVAVARSGEEPAPGTGREVIAEVSVPHGGASEALLPAVHGALGFAGADLGEVGRIVAGTGPGTFTGIRIALSTARSLALATGAALSASSTLAALAAPALLSSGEGLDILAVLDAKRRQVFAQRFAGPVGLAGGVRGGILCVAPGELPALLTAVGAPRGVPLLVGDGAVRYRGELSLLGRIPPDASPLHRVTAVGHVLSADLSPVPPEAVVPLYVREPDAETRKALNPWSRP